MPNCPTLKTKSTWRRRTPMEHRRKMVEGDSDTARSSQPFIQSSTGVTSSSMLQRMSPAAGPSRRL
ncbi:hypothetical protein AVEN_65663-1, partial [Araneus ventricosus]